MLPGTKQKKHCKFLGAFFSSKFAIFFERAYAYGFLSSGSHRGEPAVLVGVAGYLLGCGGQRSLGAGGDIYCIMRFLGWRIILFLFNHLKNIQRKCFDIKQSVSFSFGSNFANLAVLSGIH